MSNMFLVFPSNDEALARSAEEANDRDCGESTLYWWQVIQHPLNGKAAIVINSEPYDVSGLTTQEIAKLVDFNTMSASGWFPIEEEP